MTLELSDVKKFLRVDGSYEDSVIDSLIKSAVVELKLSGVKERKAESNEFPLYETAVKIIVSRDYEDRGFSDRDMRIIDSIILKLKDFSLSEVPQNENQPQ